MPSAPTLPWLTEAPPPAARRVGAPRRRLPVRRLRLLAAATCAFLATWLVVGLLLPEPPPHTVLTPVDDLPAGHVLAPADVTTVRVADQVRPAGALTDAAAVNGRRLARPVSAREILTGGALAHTSTLSPTERAVHVPVADPGALLTLRPGDHVDLVEAGAGRVVASSVRVLGVDDPAAEKSGHGLVVAVPQTAVTALVPAMSANGPGVTPTLRNP
ncbi:SAF domain-containing protein [Mobilicoccus pelagius]|uniref:SAF domain-containing protein n=1 Tax=Mobilicoccus pelagius TaxID=746032 RepID=UPI0009FC7E85|nr:SAF domain-containing protein [Mobilicoccus pelagius]